MASFLQSHLFMSFGFAAGHGQSVVIMNAGALLDGWYFSKINHISQYLRFNCHPPFRCRNTGSSIVNKNYISVWENQESKNSRRFRNCSCVSFINYEGSTEKYIFPCRLLKTAESILILQFLDKKDSRHSILSSRVCSRKF